MQFKSVKSFIAYMQEELEANRLVLPTLPNIALNIRDAVAKGNASSQELADIIITDPSLSTRLIHVANSPLYRGAVDVNSIQMAVTRLGNTTTRTLVTSLVMQQMFTPTSKLLEHYFRDVWRQGVNVSAISRALASLTTHLNADEAMLAGLIHQIGKLSILSLVENIPEFRDSPARLDKLLEKAHAPIGKIIMDTWDFPDGLKLVPSEYLDLQRNTGKVADYVDLVQVAFLQSVDGTSHPLNGIEWSTIPSFSKFDLLQGVEVLDIDGVPEQIDHARSILV